MYILKLVEITQEQCLVMVARLRQNRKEKGKGEFMKKFVCTREMAVDGGYIYPGVYEVERTGDSFVIKNVHKNVNLIVTEEEANSCGCFISWERLSEIATQALHGLLEDDRESAMEYFRDTIDLTDEEREYFGVPTETEDDEDDEDEEDFDE